MKKFLFWATVVGASLTGCVNDNETVLAPEDNPQAVTFEVAKYKASSRAGEGAQAQASTGYSTFPTTDVFGTYAWEADGHGGDHTPFMTNTKIGYVGNVWLGLDKTYFWPSDQNAHIDFVSYYPYGTAGTDAWVPTITESADGRNDFNKLIYSNYVVDGKDLMFSDKAHLQKANHKTYYQNGVPTLFRHALAKLNFMVATKSSSTTIGSQTTYWRVKVLSITVGNIYNKGTITMTTESPTQGSSAKESQWSILKNNTEEPNVWNTSGDVASAKTWSREGGHELPVRDTEKTNDGYVIFGEGTEKAQDYMIMPQKIAENQQYINIVYTIASKGSIEGQWMNEEEFSKTFTFDDLNKKGASILNWEMGKNITYKILIDPMGDLINFDPAVVEWENVDGGNIDM